VAILPYFSPVTPGILQVGSPPRLRRRSVRLTVAVPRVTQAMTLIVVTLCALFAGSVALDYGLGYTRQGGFRWLASLDGEQNPSAWYQTLSLFLCATLLAVSGVAARRRSAPRAGSWFQLAALFCFMSVDELGSLHERISEPVRALISGSGVLLYAWVVVWGAVLLVLAVVNFRWLLTLAPATRTRFLVAGLLYVLGAGGFEMLEGLFYTRVGDTHRLGYDLLILGEEALEMIGVLLFARALLLHLADAVATLELELTPQMGGVARPEDRLALHRAADGAEPREARRGARGSGPSARR
jgi:hypothetical protein